MEASIVQVCTCKSPNHAAAAAAVGVLVGLLALAEPLPHTLHMRLLLLASWAAVLLGVSGMAAAEQQDSMLDLGIFSSGSSSSSSRHGGMSPTHAAGSSSSSYLTAMYGHMAGAIRFLLLLVPKGLRRRFLPHRSMQWLGRKGSFSGNSTAGGGSSNNNRSLFSRFFGSSGSSSSSGGPGLPVSRSSPDFGDVLAPMGGARRPANLP